MTAPKRLAVAWISVVLLASAPAPWPAMAAEPEPELQSLADRLRQVLADLDPPTEFEFRDATLVVGWQTQKFLVHPRSKTGQIAAEAREAIGPSHRGFVLKVHAQPAGTVNAAVTPQTLREPYWETYLDLRPAAAGERQLFWGLSRGSRTDEALLATIRKTVMVEDAIGARAVDVPALMARHKPPYERPEGPPDPAISFERLDVIIQPGLTGSPQAPYLSIGRDGSYLYKVEPLELSAGLKKPGAAQVARLSAARMAALERLLEATRWLDADGGEGTALHTDAGRTTIAVTKNGKTRTAVLEGQRPAPYAALQKFLDDLALQEDIYYGLTRLLDGERRDALRRLQAEIESQSARPAGERAPRDLAFDRYVELLAGALDHWFSQEADELRTAVELMSLLKRQDRIASILRLRHDRDSNLRASVARALPALMGAEAAGPLADMAASTEQARIGLIDLGEPAVPAIVSLLEAHESEVDARSVLMIRALIDHWPRILQPIDARIVEAVQGAMQSESVRERGLTYHRQLLKLAGAAEPQAPTALETAREFLQRLLAEDRAQLERIRDNVGSTDQWLEVRATFAPAAKPAVEKLWIDKTSALVVTRPFLNRDGQETRLVVFMNLVRGQDWRVGPARAQPAKSESQQRQFRASHPDAQEVAP